MVMTFWGCYLAYVSTGCCLIAKMSLWLHICVLACIVKCAGKKRKEICGSDIQFIYLKKLNMKVLFKIERHKKVKSINQSLSRLSLHVPLPVTQEFFISSCLLLRHPSLICSFNCLFSTFCLQKNNITPCYWMGVLHVCVCARRYVQTPEGKRWYGCECLYLFPFHSCCVSCLSERVSVCMHTRVNGSGGSCVSASWQPLAYTPLPQSTCLPHYADLGYCPAQSTLESSTSPGISILITRHMHVNIVVSRECKACQQQQQKKNI